MPDADATSAAAPTGRRRSTRLLLGAAAALCAGASAFMLARAAVLLHTPEAAWVAPLPATPASIAEVPRPALDTGFDPFHREAPATDLPTPDLGEDAPETTLDLTLVGLRANADAPSATIKPPSGPDRKFAIGDEIIAGVTLEAVTPDYAVISRSGQLERLSLPDDSVLRRAEADTPPATVRQASSRPAPAAKRPRALGALSAGDLLQAVSTTVAVVDGRPSGIRIAGRDGFDLSEFGLRDGDVITEVNGQSLTGSPSGLQGLATTLQSNNSVSVTLLRDGATLTTRVGTP